MPVRPSHLVVTVHGIKSYGGWQERLERLVKSEDPDIDFVNYKFGALSFVSFLVPPLRRSVVNDFRRELEKLCARSPRARIDLVGHSFGTYVIAHAVTDLRDDVKVLINTIILSGSVLRSSFHWDEVFGLSARVINDCGSKDFILLLSEAFSPGTGMAGRVGFTGLTYEELRNRYSRFGHKGYFVDELGQSSDEYMRQHWVPLLISSASAAPFDKRGKPAWGGWLLEKIATPFGWIKLFLYLLLLLSPLAAGVLLLGAKKAAVQFEAARVAAELARAQEETARSEADTTLAQAADDLLIDDPDKAVLLALEALPDLSLGAGRPVAAKARLTLEKGIRASRELARLIHSGRVTSVSFSPNGRWLATSSLDRAARIFDVKTGAVVAELVHEGQVNRALFSPDGRLLATASSDKTARLWDPTTGKQVARLVQDGWGVLDVAFSPDSKLLATASGRSGDWRTKAYAQIWDVATATELARSGHDDDVQGVEFSADGRLLLTRSGKEYAPGEIRVTEVSTGKELIRKNHDSYAVLGAAFSPDGKSFASASNDNTARIWDIATGNELAKLMHDSPVRKVKFSPNGRLLATESGGGAWNKKGEARLWDVATGKVMARIESAEDIAELAFSPDGRLLATGSQDEIARVWSVEKGIEVRRFVHSGEVRSLAFSPDSRILATGSYDNRTRVLATASDVSGPEYVGGLAQLWNVADELEFPDLVGAGWVSSATFSPNGRLIAVASGGPGPFQGEARLWNGDTGATVARLSHSDQVGRAIFSPSGSLLATGTISGSYLWQVETGKPLRSLPGNGPLAFSPDSKIVVTSRNRAAELWTIETGDKIAGLMHDQEVRSAVFSRHGNLLATAAGGGGPQGYQGEARLWDARTGKLTFILKHQDWVCCVDFSDDGRLLATASNDRQARVWDTKTGEERLRFDHNRHVAGVAFSPNGHILASASDHIVYLWDVATGRKLASLLHDRSKSSVRYKVPSRATRQDGRPYGNVSAFAFSPDGLLLATAAGEVTRLWDVGTGNELAQYSSGSEGEVKSLEFDPDGTTVMAALDSGVVRRWRVFSTTQLLVDFAKARVARCLTKAEREQYSLAAAPPRWCSDRNLWPYHSKRTSSELGSGLKPSP